MRAFIAVELPSLAKEKLSLLQERLKKIDADIKWVSPKNMHLTLKFLGEIKEEDIQKIAEIMRRSVSEKNTFRIKLAQLGVFPHTKFPRVIWVGIEEGKEELEKIAQELEKALLTLKIPLEKKPFSAHITLGRVRSLKERERFLRIFEENRDFFLKEDVVAFKVEKITLFKSTLSSLGPIYEVVKEEILKAN